MGRRLFLLAAAGLVPIAVMSAIALFALYNQQRTQAERTALELTRALATAIDAELRRNISTLEALAAASAWTREPEDFRPAMEQAIRTRSNWVSLLLISTDGQQLVNTRVPRGEALPKVVEATSVSQVLSTHRPAIGRVTKGPRVGWVVPARVPVIRDGKVAYILTAGIAPESLLEVVLRQRLEEGWVVTATDTSGLRAVRWPRQHEFIGTQVSGTLQQLIASGRREGTGLTTTSEGNEVYTAFSRSPETGWVVAVGIPRAQVEAAGWSSLKTFGSGLLLSILLGSLLALAFARGVTRPMAQLREAALALGSRGEGRIVETPIREIREVSVALESARAQREAAEQEREALLQREQAARAAAEGANRAKDEFLAMLGHELRNPLAAVSNAAFLLQRPGLAPAARDKAHQVIARQVAHLSRLTDDLLDVGRAMTGKIVLRRQPLDLAVAAAQSVATLRAAGRFDRHRLEESLQSAWAEVDPVRMDQAMGNLLVNAVKYTPEGGTIRVSVRREGAAAVVEIADDGIGLTPELAARAFDLFVQGERDLDRAQGGLGIGLTLVRRIAELHGGCAEAASEGPGRGSRFRIRLPAVEPSETSASASLPPRVVKRRVLLVEDNEDARDMLEALLVSQGHEVHTAGDGAGGLDLALRHAYDIVLVDIGLPVMDGYEVARRLRARAPGLGFLVALTGYGLAEDRRRALEAGFDAHLVKPVDPRLLQEILSAAPTRQAA